MYETFVQELRLCSTFFVLPTGYLNIITLDHVKVEDSFKRGHLDTATNSHVLASGLHSVLRRVGVVHPYLWLNCGYTLISQSMEVGRPENTFEMEFSTFRLCRRLSSRPQFHSRENDP